MNTTRAIKSAPLRAMGLALLRAVHLWTGRRYRRAVMRSELQRIGREIAAERNRRAGAEQGKGGRLEEGIKRPGCGRDIESGTI